MVARGWRINGRLHDLSRRAMLMGVVNVTPDSFSDGGQFLDHDLAVQHARRLIAEGADIIDIGGESSRPGAASVPLDEEMRRVLPVLDALRGCDALLSIDTTKAAVAEAALDAGAHIINDISGLCADPQMAALAARRKAAVVVMHMRGTPQTMQQQTDYNDVVAEVGQFWRQRLDELIGLGLPADCVALDPGIGFAKSLEQNLSLLRHLPKWTAQWSQPLLLGVSRKSFIGKLLGDQKLEQREWPTVALSAHLRQNGARILRVHEVQPNLQAVRMVEAIASAGAASSA